jgi:hypothetical protein
MQSTDNFPEWKLALIKPTTYNLINFHNLECNPFVTHKTHVACDNDIISKFYFVGVLPK